MFTKENLINIEHNISIISDLLSRYTSLKVRSITEISEFGEISIEYLAERLKVNHKNIFYVHSDELSKLNNLSDKFEELDLLKIDVTGKGWEILSLLNNFLKNVNAVHIKSEHSFNKNCKVFEDIEELLTSCGFTLMDIARYKGASYSMWIKPEYLIVCEKQTEKLDFICTLFQNWLQADKFQRLFIEVFVKFLKKKIRHKFKNYIEIFNSIKCDNKIEERFTLVAFKEDIQNGSLQNVSLAPSPHIINSAFSDLEINKSWNLFDAGSGTGYVLYKLHSKFNTVTGCELNKKLYKISARNLKACGVDNYKLYCKDINEITAEEISDVNVFYMYNPFWGNTFKNFLNNIVKSIELNNRPVYIIYANSIYRNTVLRFNNMFHIVKTIKQPNYDTDIFYHKP